MKVLSIDFNIIMYPCIKLYRRYCNEEENSTINWNVIQEELEIDNFLCYDGEILKQLASLIRRNQNEKAATCLLTNHEEIVNCINNITEEQVELTNIDWYHDILGSPIDLENAKNFEQYNNANWVGYLQMKGKLSSYAWVRARNSDNTPTEVIDELKFDYKEMPARIISELPNDFDIIYFVFNPNFVPYKYKHLYDILGGI